MPIQSDQLETVYKNQSTEGNHQNTTNKINITRLDFSIVVRFFFFIYVHIPFHLFHYLPFVLIFKTIKLIIMFERLVAASQFPDKLENCRRASGDVVTYLEEQGQCFFSPLFSDLRPFKSVGSLGARMGTESLTKQSLPF